MHVNIVIFYCPPQRLNKNVVKDSSAPIHDDTYFVLYPPLEENEQKGATAVKRFISKRHSYLEFFRIVAPLPPLSALLVIISPHLLH